MLWSLLCLKDQENPATTLRLASQVGYGYSCLQGEPGAASLANPTSPFCVIKQVPFRGVACSDAAGGEMAYVQLMRLVDGGNTTSGVQWDESTGSNCTMNEHSLG